jgi:hypothetical protein
VVATGSGPECSSVLRAAGVRGGRSGAVAGFLGRPGWPFQILGGSDLSDNGSAMLAAEVTEGLARLGVLYLHGMGAGAHSRENTNDEGGVPRQLASWDGGPCPHEGLGSDVVAQAAHCGALVMNCADL